MVNDFMKVHPEIDRSTALKFLLGRKFVMERAEECYKCYQKTIVDHHFENVTVADVLEEMRTEKLYIPGTRDRNGAALFIINAAKQIPGQFPNESTLKLAFYLGEVLTSSPKTQEIGVTLISNMEGVQWANFDNQFQRTIIDFFQNNIPARVKNIILYKCPWWISMLVRMMSPFLKQKMRDRMHICESGDLFQFVEPDQLPRELGGTFVYDHDTFVKREMAKVPSSTLLRSLAATPVPANDQQGDLPRDPPPPGTVVLVSDELAESLNEERQRALAELDEKIRHRRESLHEHTLPLDVTKILRSRTARMSLDLRAMPSLEPNILHLRDSRIEGQNSLLLSTKQSPITERPGEDYDPEKLEERIARSIRKDREEFLKKMEKSKKNGNAKDKADLGMLVALDSDNNSEASFLEPLADQAVFQKMPVIPPPRNKFSRLVPVVKQTSDQLPSNGGASPNFSTRSAQVESFINLEDEGDESEGLGQGETGLVLKARRGRPLSEKSKLDRRKRRSVVFNTPVEVPAVAVTEASTSVQ